MFGNGVWIHGLMILVDILIFWVMLLMEVIVLIMFSVAVLGILIQAFYVVQFVEKFNMDFGVQVLVFVSPVSPSGQQARHPHKLAIYKHFCDVLSARCVASKLAPAMFAPHQTLHIKRHGARYAHFTNVLWVASLLAMLGDTGDTEAESKISVVRRNSNSS